MQDYSWQQVDTVAWGTLISEKRLDVVKAEDEALNLLHSRQSDLMSQKTQAIAAGDSDDVQYFKAEIIKLRALIQVRGDELDAKRAQRNASTH